MLKVYLEPNAINRARERQLSGAELRQMLEARGMLPVTGTPAIYERGRALLNPGLQELGARSSQILDELQPLYSCEGRELMKQELQHFRTNEPVRPFLEGQQDDYVREEVAELARGEMRPERAAAGMPDPTQRLKIPRMAQAGRAWQDETIFTECSYKYSLDEFARLAAEAGFAVRKVWTDSSHLFSVPFLVAA